MTDLCPCGSGEASTRCCGPLLGREKPAPTAEALMRSRYTAYVRNDMAYLEKTLLPRKRTTFSAADTFEWNADVSWTGLRVQATSGGAAGDEEGVVEFTASFVKAGEARDIHEISRFKKKGGSWFYVDGRPGGTDEAASSESVSPKPKAGRNELCPCGSGKKFKRCCG
ncbi:MAG: YchJ family protein [Solidesulfovibrio sp.]